MTSINQSNSRLSKENVHQIGKWIIGNTNNATCPICRRDPAHFSIMPFLFLFPKPEKISTQSLILRCTDCNNCRLVDAEQLFDLGCPGLPFELIEQAYGESPLLMERFHHHSEPKMTDGLNVLDKDNIVNLSDRFKR